MKGYNLPCGHSISGVEKPCVVGTKIATQVLKDGDLVEVDADNGGEDIGKSEIKFMDNFKFKSPVLKNFDPKGYYFFGLWKQNLFPPVFGLHVGIRKL